MSPRYPREHQAELAGGRREVPLPSQPATARRDLWPPRAVPPEMPPGQKPGRQQPPCPRPGSHGGSERVPNLHERQPKIADVVNVMLTGVRSREIPASLLSPHPSACARTGATEASPALSGLLQPEGRIRAPGSCQPSARPHAGPAQRLGSAAAPRPPRHVCLLQTSALSAWQRRRARCSLLARTPPGHRRHAGSGTVHRHP